MRLRRRQHEDGVGRRLFQRLQEGVKCLSSEHVDLVHDVHLVTRFVRGEVDLIPQAADIINCPIAGRVDLYQVHCAAFVHRKANLANVVRLAILRIQAVHCLCQDSSCAGLAGAPGTAKEIGMSHLAQGHGAPQRLSNRLLTNDAFHASWPPLPVEYFAHMLLRLKHLVQHYGLRSFHRSLLVGLHMVVPQKVEYAVCK